MAYQQTINADFSLSINNTVIGPDSEQVAGSFVTIKSATGMNYMDSFNRGRNGINGPSVNADPPRGTVQLIFNHKIDSFTLDVQNVHGKVYLYGFNIGLPHQLDGNMVNQAGRITLPDGNNWGRCLLIWRGLSTNTVTFSIFDPGRTADLSSHGSLVLTRYSYTFVEDSTSLIYIGKSDKQVHGINVGTTNIIMGEGAVDTLAGTKTRKYHWQVIQQPEGSMLSYENDKNGYINFLPKVVGSYIIERTENDGKRSTHPLRIEYLAEQAKNKAAASFTANKSAFIGERLVIDSAITSEPNNDALTYFWTLKSPVDSVAELDNPRALMPSFTPDVEGVYAAQLIVNNDLTNSLPVRAVWVVNSIQNKEPIAHQGDVQTLITGETAVLDGSNSHDLTPAIVSYHWSLVEKPRFSRVALESTRAVKSWFTPDIDGRYIVELIVSDEQISLPPIRVAYIAANPNQRPVAMINSGYTGLVNTEVELSSEGSSDPDGDNILYRWTLTTPANSQIILNGTSISQPSFIPDVEGIYTVELIVANGKVDSTPAVAAWAVEAMPVVKKTEGLLVSVNYKGGAHEESVELTNTEEKAFDLSGVCLKVATTLISAQKNSTYTFEQGATLRPGETVIVNVHHSEKPYLRSFNSALSLLHDYRPCFVEVSLEDKILATYVMNTPTYTVKAGDTLDDIAAQVYDNRDRWQEIAHANDIDDPSRTTVGMVLVIPE